MTGLGEIGELVEVGGTGEDELSVEWHIRDVLSLPGGSDDFYQSPDFGTGGGGRRRWALRLFPNRTDRRMRWATGRILRSASKALKIYLVRWDEGGEPELYSFCVWIRGTAGARQDKKVLWNYPACLWVFHYPRLQAMEERDGLMPDGVLTVTCDIKRDVPDVDVDRGVSSGRGASIRNDSETGELVASDNGSQSTDKQGHQSSDECIICCEQPVDCALYRCGHMCTCYDCAFKLWKSNSSAECPICRNSIQDVLKIYK